MTAPIRPESAEERRRRLAAAGMSQLAQRSDATRVGTDPNYEPGMLRPSLPVDLAVGMVQYAREKPVEFGLSMTPGIGDAMSVRDAVRDVGAGNYGMAALNALAAVPLVGMVGDVAKNLGKGAKTVKATRVAKSLRELKAGESVTRATRSGGAIPNFRQMSPEEAVTAAREGQHLRRVGESDQYVGAPRGVESPKQLRAMRENYDEAVEQGVEGGDWYDRAMRSTVEAGGYDPARQRLFAQEAGLWSAQANPDANLGFMLQGHNAYEFGTPAAKVRTGAQARRYNAARDAGTDIPLGPKTGQYTNKFDPTSPNSHISTNDIWHFRNWGYTQDGKPWSAGGTPQMHSFVDAESILAADRANARMLGGRTDWDAASTQAAPWVYAKGKALHEKYPKRYPTLEDGVAEAAKTYNDSFDKYTAFGTSEAIPGAGTGHLDGIVDAPSALRAEYSADPRSSWSFLTDQERTWRDQLPASLRGAGDGRDVLYDAAGMYVRPSNDATGFFRPSPGAALETNPSRVARPLVALERSKAGPVMRAADQRATDAIEALRAYLDAQNAGAWHKVLPEGRVRDASSLSIPMGRKLTEDEVRSLAAVVEPHGFGVVDTGQGVTLLNLGDGPADGAALRTLLTKGGLADKIEAALPDAVGSAERVRVNSGYVMQDEGFQPLMRAENAGSGKATASLERYLTDPAIPDMLDKLDADPRLRQAALARFERDAEYAERLGSVAREDIQRARQIVAESGLKGLFEAARRGVVLPVLALGVLGGASAMTPTEPDA